LFAKFFTPSTSSSSSASGGVNTQPILKEGSVIGVEVNMDKHTAHFFIDGKQMSEVVSGVPSPIFFGISSEEGKQKFSFLSFQQLASPSIDATVPCEMLEWMN
jgi:hypothetical protein